MKTSWVLVLALPVSAMAGQLNYQPVNPSFGGNPMNGSYLLQNAGAQNSHTGPQRTRTTTSTTERFARSLESRLTSQLLSDLTGSSSVTEGSLTTSDFTLSVSEYDPETLVEGLYVEIQDNNDSSAEPIKIFVEGLQEVDSGS